jgi:hypothetical protein
MSIILKEPTFEELEFRQRMMADENTMHLNYR